MSVAEIPEKSLAVDNLGMMATPPLEAPLPPAFVAGLLAIVGLDGVLSKPAQLLVYECDGYVVEKQTPDVVVFPQSTGEVAAVVKLCQQYRVPFVPRGAGTSLAGGCLAVGGGVMIALTRMTKILEINLRDRYAVVEAGVVNVHLTQALKGSGYHYAPDPSSQGACTLGGNLATNAGGPHTLKYGVTVNHVLGVEAVMPDGQVVQFGGPLGIHNDYDLTGLFVGGEGTLGICTQLTLRLSRDAAGVRTMLGVFDTVDAATQAISDIIGAGIVPAALEMMDQGIVQAVEDAYHFGFPLDAGAVLLVEVDGLEVGVGAEAQRVVQLCQAAGAREVRTADTPKERQLLWKCRKQAFGAIGRISPSYCTQDGVVPRTRLPEMIRFIGTIATKYDLKILNVAHAGDGNIHPILLFDERDKAQTKRVLEASDEILSMCIELGGSVTGEHGIGVEKLSFMPKLFSETDLAVMHDVHHAFNAEGLCSPGKLIPTSAGCGNEYMPRIRPGRHAAM